MSVQGGSEAGSAVAVPPGTEVGAEKILFEGACLGERLAVAAGSGEPSGCKAEGVGRAERPSGASSSRVLLAVPGSIAADLHCRGEEAIRGEDAGTREVPGPGGTEPRQGMGALGVQAFRGEHRLRRGGLHERWGGGRPLGRASVDATGTASQVEDPWWGLGGR